MGVARTLKQYLKRKDIHFELIEHEHSNDSYHTALKAHIDSGRLVKAVVFRDEDLHYTVCILPAQNKVRRLTLNNLFDRHMELADEEELTDLFHDCELGAVPAIAQAYGLNLVWDDELLERDEVYLEAGDHSTLIKLKREDFANLMNDRMHEHFSQARAGLSTGAV